MRRPWLGPAILATLLFFALIVAYTYFFLSYLVPAVILEGRKAMQPAPPPEAKPEVETPEVWKYNDMIACEFHPRRAGVYKCMM